MSGHGVPAPYLGASRLGADGNAMLALARAKWLSLTPTQQQALIGATRSHGSWRISVGSVATSRSMFDQGLVASTDKWAKLTGYGLMVREAGVYSREVQS